MLFGEVVSAACHSEHNKEVNSGLSSQFQKIKMTGKHFLSITLVHYGFCSNPVITQKH